MQNNRDAVIEGRLDSKDLALCARFLVKKGFQPRSMSDLMYLITQLAAYTINEPAFETLADARGYLESIGLGGLNRSGRGKVKFAAAMQQEALQNDGFDPSYGAKRMTLKDMPSEDDIHKMIKDLNTLDMSSADEKGRVNEAAFKAKEDAKLAGMKSAMQSIAESKNIMLGDKKGE